jgi:hypothetical protein
MKNRRWVGGVLLAGLAALGCFTACVGDASCEDAGREFQAGAHWTCSDGCNGCTCDDGTIVSTAKGCPTPPGPAAGKLHCWSGSYWQEHGTHWACNNDGCTDCSCNDGRIVREALCGDGGSGA